MGIETFWRAPEVNPINGKARSIPFFNVFNVYGRVFHFSWFGFMIAFWAWYAFPPLLPDIVAMDDNIKSTQILNSNIVALIATLLVRLVAGPCCDRFGPRNTFAGCLLLGAIPSFCAGGVYNASGLMAVRFFIGILGGSFVPCQVWTTGFYDKNVVGTANALTGGWGNAGGGITYFVMPAIYNSLWQHSGLSKHNAWRVSFVVPGILIVATAIGMVLLCPETPTGKWSEREAFAEQAMRRHSMVGTVDVPGELSTTAPEKKETSPTSSVDGHNSDKKDVLPPVGAIQYADHEAHLTAEQMYETAKGEIVRKPTFKEALPVIMSLQTLVTTSAYFCSFGAELAINSILGAYYMRQFKLSLQDAGNWAAMFGLLNVVFRPLGGYISDQLYKATGQNLWAKKAWLHFCGLVTGGFLIAIGVLNSKSQSTMFGLIAGMAFFLEAGNGANFALVPHVHPHANGIMSGLTGAAGNLGGIIFAVIFRVETAARYGKAIWIIGVMTIAMNLAVCWIRPIPKGQIGGR
ncbi:hypothetical protein FH972_024368 [Carpinus fangiana]|uniref:Nitrate/nitrite transporter n=1 Tax=Carpinus fangiana TaxID=176857 RepID=A0A5N6KY81_9ROSI|nr:hypothetical protein FH972_024368 [Carpinus fangiana]